MGRLATWEGWCAGGGGGGASSGVGEAVAVLKDGGNGTIHHHIVVEPGVLGDCFQDLVVYSGASLLVILHACVLVVQLSLKARRATKRRANKPLFVWRGEWLRGSELLACVACIAVPIVQIIALNRQHAAWILFTALNGVCWLLYASVLQQHPEEQLRRCHYRPSQRGVTRAPWSLRLTGLLLTASGAYRLFTLLKMNVNLRSADTIGELMQLSTFFLHPVLVLVSLCVPMRPRFLRHTVAMPRSATTSIQGTGEDDEEPADDHEFTPLLAHTLPAEDDQVFQYGSVDRVAADPSIKAPETGASFLSKLVFQWADPLLHFGYLCNMLRSGDLFALPKDLNTERLCDTFSSHVFALRETHGDKHFVLRAFNRCYGWRYYPLAFLKILADAAGFAGPLLLHELVQLIDEEDPDYSKGYLYAGLLCASTAFGSFCNTHYTFQVNKTQVAVRAAVTSSVFRKALRSRVGEKASDKQDSDIEREDERTTAANGGAAKTSKQGGGGGSNKHREEEKEEEEEEEEEDKKRSLSTVGGVMNLMSTDADRLANFCPSFHQFWSLPFQIAVSLYLLYLQVGLSFLAGLFFAIVMIPLNRAVAKRIGALGKDLMHNKDERVKLTGEVVSAIRVVRMYAWEQLFEKRINTIRERELKALRGRKYLDAVCVYLWATTPVLISISTFATYSLLGNRLTAATVFTSMALFNILIGPLNAFPWVLNGLVEAWVSLDRVESYLRLRYTFASAQQVATAAAAEAAAVAAAGTTGTAASTTPSPLRTSPAASTSSPWASNATQQSVPHTPAFTSATPRSAAAAVALPAAAGDLALSVDHAFFAWQDVGTHSPDQSGSQGGGSGSNNTSSSSSSMGWSGRARRGDSSSMCLLRDVSLSLGRTEWMCVTGEVGSGKTMLLLGILGELAPVRGSVRVSAAVAKRGVGYVPQEPWILNATIRDNILCGRPMYRRLYDQVLHACALLEDLHDIRGGDMAELGENGINLSGGQKARIGLARAAYQQLPLYLLDSPLAALDRPTARHVLQHCVCRVMSGSARVLVTENPDAVAAAPRVLRAEEGCLVDARSPHHGPDGDDSDDGCSGEGDAPGVHHGGDRVVAARSASQAQGQSQAGDDEEAGEARAEEEEEEEEEAAVALSTGGSTGYNRDGLQGRWTKEEHQEQEQEEEQEQLLSEEDRVVGTVRAAVYATYLRAVGAVLATAVLVSLTLMQGSRNVSDWWLSNWVTHADANSSADARQYLEIYGFISAGNTVFTLLRAFLFAYAGVVAARAIHRRLLHSVFSARIDFFDRNPAGRIVNRFSSDINSVDDSLPFIANILLAQLFGLVGTVAVMCYSQPYFLFLLVPLGAVYYRIQRYYRQTSREVKRLGNIARSPIYAHFSESLTGVVSVRAMHMVRQFELENVARMNANQVASYNEQVVSQWLGVRLQVLGVAMLTGVAFLAAVQHHSGGADPGLAGLAISYALSVTGVLQGLVTSFTETEKEMVCVERCDAFIHAEQEEDDSVISSALAAEAADADVEASPIDDLGGHTLDGDGAGSGRRRGWRRRSTHVGVGPLWPQYGQVLFKDVTVRYRADLPPALRNFTLSVRAGEKLGICGRTGAGKSTLFRALLRMVGYSGNIVIDGVDIALVRRARLRRSVAVIPQDPVMFSGTVRSNLDPFDQHSTAELLDVLDKCCLRGRVGSLAAEVEEQGRNLSSGEKQLVCLGRALLRGCRILCIDEATANVDARTDALVQTTIQENFRSCTVMTIAHRTNTLAHCDRVIHFGRGRLEAVEDRSNTSQQGPAPGNVI